MDIVVPDKRYSNYSRGKNPQAWKKILSITREECGKIPDNLPLTENALKNWEKNKSFLGYTYFSNLSPKDCISIISAVKRNKALLGVDRWGRVAYYKILNERR
jgi:hypothetical protein